MNNAFLIPFCCIVFLSFFFYLLLRYGWPVYCWAYLCVCCIVWPSFRQARYKYKEKRERKQETTNTNKRQQSQFSILHLVSLSVCFIFLTTFSFSWPARFLCLFQCLSYRLLATTQREEEQACD